MSVRSEDGGKVYSVSGLDGVVVYVGATSKSLMLRLRQHVNHMNRPETYGRPFYGWLRANYPDVTITLLEECRDADSLDDAERKWIHRYPDLLNLMTGGTRGGRHSAETQQKMKDAKVGYVMSAETREKISASNKSRTGVKHTDEAREKIRQARARQVIPPRSDATRKKMSEARTRYWQEWRARRERGEV